MSFFKKVKLIVILGSDDCVANDCLASLDTALTA